jgi:hypothetical protein
MERGTERKNCHPESPHFRHDPSTSPPRPADNRYGLTARAVAGAVSSAGVVMGWKKVALAGCLPVVGGGCHLAKLACHNVVNEPLVAHTEKAIERGTRSDAKAAWQQVREQFPRRMFTADFRDGFIDGYGDYLAHGGTAQPPAVPPLKYTRNKKYYTPEGHCLIRDYYLGFKYGADVAVATGQRKFLTVPVLLADVPTGPPTFNVQPAGAEGTLPTPPPASKPEPLGTPKQLPAPPGGTGEPAKQPDPPAKPPEPPAKTPKIEVVPVKPGLPWESPATVPNVMPKPGETPKGQTPPKKAEPSKDVGSKFGAPATTVSLPKPDAEFRLPIPDPPLPTIPAIPLPLPTPTPVPVPVKDTNPVRPTPPPLPKVYTPAGAIKPVGFLALPEPPSEVPTLPDHLPTPSVLDELPVMPANHTVPAALPANHTVPPALPQ